MAASLSQSARGSFRIFPHAEDDGTLRAGRIAEAPGRNDRAAGSLRRIVGHRADYPRRCRLSDREQRGGLRPPDSEENHEKPHFSQITPQMGVVCATAKRKLSYSFETFLGELDMRKLIGLALLALALAGGVAVVATFDAGPARACSGNNC